MTINVLTEAKKVCRVSSHFVFLKLFFVCNKTNIKIYSMLLLTFIFPLIFQQIIPVNIYCFLFQPSIGDPTPNTEATTLSTSAKPFLCVPSFTLPPLPKLSTAGIFSLPRFMMSSQQQSQVVNIASNLPFFLFLLFTLVMGNGWKLLRWLEV